jgi:hypothetical protein
MFARVTWQVIAAAELSRGDQVVVASRARMPARSDRSQEEAPKARNLRNPHAVGTAGFEPTTP